MEGIIFAVDRKMEFVGTPPKYDFYRDKFGADFNLTLEITEDIRPQ